MTLLQENAYRDAARELLEWAGQGPVGVPQTSPIYLSVTEGREGLGTHTGTSCAEVAHWELFRLGIRSMFVNRNEAHGWKPGLNVSMLAFASVAQVCQPGDEYKAGDIIIIWERKDTYDAHVMCVIDYEPKTMVLTTCEYGQPGGKLATHQLRTGTDTAGIKPRNALFCGGRALQKWVPLMVALQYADKRGELQPIDLSCTVIPTPDLTSGT